MTRRLLAIAALATSALSCATRPPFPQRVADGYRAFANGDCPAVRAQARAIAATSEAFERAAFRLLEGYCLEFEGNAPDARRWSD